MIKKSVQPKLTNTISVLDHCGVPFGPHQFGLYSPSHNARFDDSDSFASGGSGLLNPSLPVSQYVLIIPFS